MGKPTARQENLVVTNEFIEVIAVLLKVFEGDVKKVRFWMITPNLNLGGVAPLRLIVMGKVNKVVEFVHGVQEAD